jgi:uncharacterized protein (TIGR02266 family)
MSDGQRQTRRVPLQVEVTLESEHNFFAGITNNVSEGGIFVATPNPPVVGSQVAFELVLGEKRFAVKGVVQWIRGESAASQGAPVGCGVKWLQLADGALEAIHDFSEVRQTDLYEED